MGLNRLTLVDTPEGRFNGRLRVSEPVLDCGVNLIQLRTGSGCALQTVTAAARSALLVRRLTLLRSESLPILLAMREAGGARRRSRFASMAGGSHRSGHVGKRNLIHFCSYSPPQSGALPRRKQGPRGDICPPDQDAPSPALYCSVPPLSSGCRTA